MIWHGLSRMLVTTFWLWKNLSLNQRFLRKSFLHRRSRCQLKLICSSFFSLIMNYWYLLPLVNISMHHNLLKIMWPKHSNRSHHSHHILKFFPVPWIIFKRTTGTLRVHLVGQVDMRLITLLVLSESGCCHQDHE